MLGSVLVISEEDGVEFVVFLEWIDLGRYFGSFICPC
jgi:hypothetical protein